MFAPFRGGVHPKGFKELSAEMPIKTLPIPARLFVPLKQHAGSPAIAMVKEGERVLKGQMIATAGLGLSAPIHAPTSGIIQGVEDIIAAHPSGLTSKAIIINSDGLDESWQIFPSSQLNDPYQQTPEVLSQLIGDSGIVGMGGASFPAAVKLQSATEHNTNLLLINGGECEPYLTADDRLMQEQAKEIVEGARLVQYIIRCRQIVIAIEDNKKKAIESMKNAAKPFPDIRVIVVPSIYPMGSSKQMVQAVIGKEIPAGSHTTDLGILIHNVATVHAVYRYLVKRQPLISRIVTVSGSAVKTPQNIEVLIGTPIKHLFDSCGGFVQSPERFILGGPMMGHTISTDEVPIMKGSGGVLALSQKEIPNHKSSPCIRCARCVEACPMQLLPLEMAKRSKINDIDGAVELGLKDCILCGSCSYVCPSHIPLVQFFQFAKGEVSKEKAHEKRLSYTKQLSQAKEARLKREAEEKAALKAAKAKKRNKSRQTSRSTV